MPVISISLTDKNVEDLESLQKDLGFTGRSEAIRAAMRTLLAENNERRSMVGKVDGVLIVI
ncbi:MAG: ribbon-helix-helix protein, CopG family, partial [Methanomassiliicoccales archaeon]|nr:ribbon-helix-helix protein, CopG family [Methanomassiliicoccales archaeon]